jgi:hypothetical protein
MHPVRRRLLQHPWLAAWLVASTLLLRIVVPTGYMIGFEHGAITIELCSGYGPMKMDMPMPGMSHNDHKDDHGKTEQPCAFSGLSMPSLAAADPLLLALAIIFILFTAFRRPDLPIAGAPDYFRPPLRGPPARS